MYRLVFLLLLLTHAPLRAAEFESKALDAVIEKGMTEMQVPGAAVVVVQYDRIIYMKAFGVREKGKPETVTTDTVFAIASCSKAFTSTALAMLVDDGKLKWDDKVRQHLDYFRISDELADRDVTVRDLLCHRSGMPRHDLIGFGQDIGSEDLIRQWGKGRPSTSFRSTWEYSNVPFTTAGVIAGKLEHSDWATVMKKRIFDPLQMKASSCTYKEGSTAPNHATPHYMGVDKTISAVKWDEIDSAGGAGCINSTVPDLANWLRFQLGGGRFEGKRLVSENSLKETHTSQMLFKPQGPFALYFPEKAGRFHAYGLGWFVHDYRGFDCVSHGGTLTGFRAQCMMIPDKKIGVFVVCNLRPSVFCEAVAKTALDQLLGLPAEDWVKDGKSALSLFEFNIAATRKKHESARKPDTKPSLPMKSYTGNYNEAAYGRADVTFDGENLLVRWGRYKFRLDHFHFDTFTAIPIEPVDEIISFDRSTLDVQFHIGVAGEVDGMKLFDQNFQKLPPKK
jgi:CubicO group peptidase (beta-lactamase class C family)